MPSAYILLLIVSLAAVWIYWQTSQDIFVLVALVGLGSFVWGFNAAPGEHSASDCGVAVGAAKVLLGKRSKF